MSAAFAPLIIIPFRLFVFALQTFCDTSISIGRSRRLSHSLLLFDRYSRCINVLVHDASHRTRGAPLRTGPTPRPPAASDHRTDALPPPPHHHHHHRARSLSLTLALPSSLPLTTIAIARGVLRRRPIARLHSTARPSSACIAGPAPPSTPTPRIDSPPPSPRSPTRFARHTIARAPRSTLVIG